MLGSVGMSGRMMMPMKAALTWGHPMMLLPPTIVRTAALQMRATVEGGWWMQRWTRATQARTRA
jgi:hypothetical protein